MKLIHTETAPAAIGPYSQASVWNGLIFTSGQIALVPETGQLIEGGIEAQVKQSLHNLTQILRAGGSDVSEILKVVIFLKNMDDFALVNRIYESWLQGHRPARSTVEVSVLPRHSLIEIEAIARVVQ